MGRPTKMTSYTIQKLKEAFLFGASDREACLYAGICRDTLHQYQKKNSSFSDQKEEWKTNPLLKARKTVFDNLHKENVAMWYLSRKAKSEFGDLRQLNSEEKEYIVKWSE